MPQVYRTRLAGCAAVFAVFFLAAQSVFGDAAIPWADNQAPEFSVSGFQACEAVAVDAAHGKLYITDRDRHRVLRFSYPLAANLTVSDAEMVFGQADFSGTSANRGAGSPAANSFNIPYALAVSASGDLWVADEANNRVVKYPSAWNATLGASATVVLGQTSATASGSGNSSIIMSLPAGLAIDASDNLWVGERGNNRVTRFANASSLTTGASAVQVLGEVGFNTSAGGMARNLMSTVFGVAVSGTTLWVADYGNNRILRFDNAASKGNGGNADGVLGQAGYTSGQANRGIGIRADTLFCPAGVAADAAGTLYVADSFNSRVLIFLNAASKANGAAADHYLGAGNFTSSGNVGTVWLLAYEPTLHRLFVGNVGSAGVNQYYNCYTTTTTVSASPNPCTTVGAPVTLTATVANTLGSGPAASGYVLFKDGGTNLGTAALDGTGVANFITTSLADGNHSISAVLTNTPTHQGSTSSSYSEIVGKYTPTVTLAASPNPCPLNVSATFTATVTPGSGAPAPSGTVDFYIDGNLGATVSLAGGSAGLTTNITTEGSHEIKATYSGDSNFRSGTATLAQTVNPEGLYSLMPVANIENDYDGANKTSYDGTYYNGFVYAGSFGGSSGFSAFKFDLSALTGTISKATLRLCVGDTNITSNFNVDLFGSSDDSWTDIPVPTAPGSSNTPAIATFNTAGLGNGTWVTNDVTSFVTSEYSGNKLASFLVTSESANLTDMSYVGFCSKEDLLGRYPALEVQMVTKVDQAALSFNPTTPQIYGTTNALSVSGGSGSGAVSYSVLSGPGEIVAGNQLLIKSGSGTVTIVASKAGDSNYNPASITNSVEAALSAQAPLVLTAPSPQVYGTTNTISATGGTLGGPITYSVVSGPGQIIAGPQLVATAGSGVIQVSAMMMGDGNYFPVSVTNTVVSTLAPQANFTFNPTSPQAYNTTNSLLATGGSGTGTISYSVLTGPGQIVNGTQLVATAGSGAIEVVATKDTDGNYAAISVTNTVNAALASQSPLTFDTTTPQVYGTTNSLSASGGSGTGAFSYSVLSGPGQIVNGTQVVAMAGSGTIAVIATRTGDANYADASITNFIAASKLNLLVSGVVVKSKPYDGNRNATVDYSSAQLVGVITPDSVSLDTNSATATFSDKVAGNGKAVTILGLALTGTEAGNYTLTQPALFANISKINLGVKANDVSRAYGDPNPAFTFTYSGFAGGDNEASLTTPPTATSTAATNSWIGKYPIVPSGGSSPNYTLSYTNGQLTVTKAPLQIAADNFSRAYGATNPTFTATITGIKNNDDITAAMITTATNTSAPGDYSINVNVVDNTGKLGAYSLSIKKGILSITNAVLTGQVASVSRAYGQTNPLFSVEYTGFVNGETTNVLQGELTYSCLDTNDTPVDATTPVGAYPVEVLNVQSNANYTINYLGGTLTVTQAVLTVAANNANKVYGDAMPALSASYSGFVNGENTNALGGALVLATTATASSSVGNYDITPSGFTSTNYSLVYSNGNLAVTPATLTVTITNASKVYGQANPSFGGDISGAVNGDIITATYVSAAGVGTSVGTYPIVPSFADLTKLGNYNIVTNGGTLSISSASLTGTVLSYARAYGDTNPPFAINYTGFVSSDTASIVTGTPLFACVDALSNPVTTNTPVGDYPITVAVGQSAPNYSISYQHGTLSITQAVLTVTANNASRVYGETNPPLDATITGFVNNETTNNLTGQLVVTTTATPASGVGPYPITASGFDSSNYHIDYVDGVLTVGKASLTVTADDKTRSYGDTNPVFTAKYSGFVDGDTESVITGTPSLTTTADSSSNVGDYAITATNGTLSASNYALIFVDGKLSVTPGSLTVTIDPASRAYGVSNPALTGSLAGLTNDDNITVSFTSTAAVSSVVGAYGIDPSFNDPSNHLGNYLITTNPASLTVTQALLSVSANNKTRNYGQANPSFDGSLSGAVAGDGLTASYTCTADTFTAAGAYPILASINDPNGKLSNYQVTTNDGTLTIDKALLTVTAKSQRRNYGAPNPDLTLLYSGFVGTDTVASLAVVPTATVNADTNSWIGTYPIVPSGGAAANYDFSYVNGTLTVGKPQLIVTVDNQRRLYGVTNPPLTFTITGVANNDDLGTYVFTSATTNSAPGQYDIEVGFDDPDGLLGLYDVSAYGGVLDIDKAPLIGTVQNASRTYGVDNPAFAVTYSGFANGETNNVLSGSLAYSCKTLQGSTVTKTTAAGTYAIHVSTPQTSANYDIHYTDGTLTVNRAALTVNVNNASRVYGAANPTFDGAILGLVNSDVITATYSTTATPASPATTYPITPILADLASKLGNYNVTTNLGTLTVTPASLTGTIADATRAYGDTNPVFQVSYSGYVNGDTDSVVTGPLGFSCLDSNTVDVTTNTTVGLYSIHVSAPQTASNYSIQYTDGQLTITQAVLTVTAQDKSRAYGLPNPDLTYDITGFANNEDTNVVSGAPLLSTLATPASPIGSYDILVDLATLSATNYSFVTNTGSFHITKGDLIVQAASVGRAYGESNPTFIGQITGIQNGDDISATYDSAAGPTNAPGTYAIVPTLVDPNNLATNYTVLLTNGTLTVSKADLTVLAGDANRLYGQSNPTFTGTVTGIQNSDPITVDYTTTADAASPTGNYDITPKLTDTADKLQYYNVYLSNGTLIISPAALSFTADNTNRVYGASNPVFTGSVTGVQNGDKITATYDSAVDPATSVGAYAIVPNISDPDNKLSNYTVSTTNGVLTITAAPLSVIANDTNRLYGAVNPDFTGVVSGVVNNDGITATYTTPATPASGVGLYSIVPQWVDPNNKIGNYSPSVTNGTLAVGAVALRGSVWSFTRGYGETNPVFGVTYSGYVNGESDTILTGVLGLSCLDTNGVAVDTNTTVGVYPITVSSPQGAPNYSVSYANGSLTITQAVLLVTADNTNRVYGASNPTLTATITGFVNGEDTNVVSGQADLTTTATPSSPVGDYDIVAALGTLSATNYSFTLTNGTLTVNHALLSVTADSTNRVYGAGNPAFTGTVAGVQNADRITATYDSAVDPATSVGAYAIVPNISDPDNKLSNYTVSTINGVLTITAAPLSVIANDTNRLYGAANPEFTGTVTGVVNNDGITATYTTPATPASGVGLYSIVPHWVDPNNKIGNYSPSVTNGTLAVGAVALRGSVWSFTRGYGETNPVFGVTYSGYVNGESDAILTGALSLSCLDTNGVAVDTNTTVGVYPITVSSPQGAPNYSVSYANGSLTITQAVLLVTADNTNRVYGASNPTLTATITGFVNGEDTNVVSGQADLTTTATPSSPVGDYDIVAALGTLSATNYSFTLTNGTLTIGKAELTVTADNTNRIYGADNPTFTATVTGFVDGDTTNVLSGEPVLSTLADTNSPIGTYAISAAAGSLKATNYAFKYVEGTLSIGPAPLTITADDQSRVYGGGNPTLTISYTGFVNGQDSNALITLPSIDTMADATSPVGQYAITITGGQSTNYDITRVNGTLSVTQALLTATADDQTRAYGSGNPTLTISYSGFVNSDNAAKLQTPPAAATAADAATHTGKYPITLSGGSDANYTFKLVDGNLTITQAVLTATAKNLTRKYGASNPTLEIIYSGFQNSDDATVVDTPPAIITTATPASYVGSYPITLSGGLDNDYTIALVDGTLSITPADLTIKAADASRPYGAGNPAFTGTITGIQNGDGIGATYATAADTNSVAGTYAIVPTTVDPSNLSSNYTVALVDGTLTVTAALQLTPTPGYFVVGDVSTKVDDAGKVADGGSLNFDGATLTVSIVTNASSQDFVFIDPDTNSPVSVDKQDVLYNGVVFGSFTGGDGVNPLVITFNTNATSAQLTALIDQLAFTTTDESANLRAFELTLVYNGITVTGSRTILLNRAPVPGDDTFLVKEGVPMPIAFSALLANDTDPDGDKLTVVGASRTSYAGGVITRTATGLIYNPPTPAVDGDTFAYMVSDGHGGTSIGLVTLVCVKPFHVSVKFDDNGQPLVRMGGTPGATYQVYVSEDLENWTPMGSVTATVYGAIQIPDPDAKDKPHRFYRAVAQ